MTTRTGDRTRIVVTGMGAITPLGNSVDEFWRGCVEGRSGIDWISIGDPYLYPVKIDGEVRSFDPSRYMDGGEAQQMPLFARYAVAAARMAVEDAGLRPDEEDRSRIGVCLGNAGGGYPEEELAVRTLVSKGPRAVDELTALKVSSHMGAAWVAKAFALEGFTNTVATACAAATQAIGRALDAIRLRRADVVLAGGAEASLCELGMAAFTAMRALSIRSDDPAKASRPFDLERDGFVASEGAAVLVLESLEHARARRATVLAELVGYGASSDAYHVVIPAPSGEGARQAIALALADARVAPTEVDYINAHGTSTPMNDVMETIAIKAVFGERAYSVPVSSTKSMIGHALGAAGAIESVACIKAIETGIIPPTINYEHPDPACDLDYVPNTARRGHVNVVLKNSFAFGGQNACLVFRAFED